MKRSLASAFSPNRKASDEGALITGVDENEAAKVAKFKPFGGMTANSAHENSNGNGNGKRSNQVASPFKKSPTRRLLVGSKKVQGGDGGDARVDLTTQKLINDPIHTNVRLDRLCCRIIDTPQFQRLRNLKQLGTCVYVFPSATHSRFEHSLGVAHLSQRVCTSLYEHQQELGITEADILSVKVAGLCHDLGHGPFSHVFDGVFIKEMYPNGLKNKDGTKWRHEDGSVQMFRYILQDNDIRLEEFGLSGKDQLFIEEIIQGTAESERQGRGPEKFFLYDVVNNTRSGLDVDKLDYFQRDMRYANVTLAANFERFIELGRVSRATRIPNTLACKFEQGDTGGWVPSQTQEEAEEEEKHQLMVCYPQKLVYEALDIFSIRFRMHKQVYTHKAVKQVEFMITDALKASDPYIKIQGAKTKDHPDGQYRMSECIFDMTAMSNLNDSVIELIKYDPNPGLRHAKEIIRRIEKRQLYTCLGRTPFKREDDLYNKSDRAIKAEIIAISQSLAADPNLTGTRYAVTGDEIEETPVDHAMVAALVSEGTLNSQDSFYSIGGPNAYSQASSYTSVALEEDDIIVEKMHIHYGLKDKNPVGRLRFFAKNCKWDTVAKELNENVYLASMPNQFEEFAVRVFCKSRSGDKESTAKRAFQQWCKEKMCSTPFLLPMSEEEEQVPEDMGFPSSQP